MDPRVALVTGGGTGIGRAVAAAFAKQGDEVVILGRRAEVEAAVEWVVAEVGPAVDVLVNGEIHHVNGGWLFGR